ncbi:MAG: nitrite/sulfite reductase [Gammaproteobacteria bacterium]|nr:nitrite/sulfite reductase [Gammaproteobacteria bacterium]
MYAYDRHDQTLLEERVAQFRDQVARRLAGKLTEDEFRPLRLLNGLYREKHAPMLRVAIPYGLMSSAQLRRLAHVARRYDRGYGHFTTRQNIQFNWVEVEETPALLAELAEVQVHAIQSSGNCIRNISADPLAGVAPDEVADPRPYCEILRQWSLLHPEFSFLPRKFKIAFSGSARDRAALAVHDIAFRVVRREDGSDALEVLVGGGLGRTPRLARVIHPALDPRDLLSYTEAMLRVYNLHGRRDNLYKARIKILVDALGIDGYREQVEAEWQHLRHGPLRLTDGDLERMAAHFVPPPYERTVVWDRAFEAQRDADPAFAAWLGRCVGRHRVPGYRVVTVPLKAPGRAPGDMDAGQMDALAGLADRYSFGEIRSTHQQNLVLAHVRQGDLHALWRGLREHGLAHPNAGLLTDMICCPGAEYCSLASAGSIPVAREIQHRFVDLDRQLDLGEIELKISGCVNACGHHHVGHIGLLGVDRNGEEYYQLQLGGSAAEDASLGKVLGPALPRAAVVDAIEAVLTVYVALRRDGERFIDTLRRLGPAPFKERVYARQ